ncbi:hypothetical protein QFZ47_003063 [Variovorax paradoxus]|nr:hypothetical protein [Variovorax paradoxus]
MRPITLIFVSLPGARARAASSRRSAPAALPKAPGTPRVRSCRAARWLLSDTEMPRGPSRIMRSAMASSRTRVPLMTDRQPRPSSRQLREMWK